MTELHASLRAKLKRLRAAPITFDAGKKCFVINGRRKHGLTRLLSSLVPVPRSTRTAASTADTKIQVRVQQFAGSTMRRCGHCDAAVKWLRNSNSPVHKSISTRLRAERNIDRAHGIVLDYQLSFYARTDRKTLFQACGVVDPCVGTLLEQLDANQWCVVGTQLPIYDAASDCATALDVLVTDRETRRQLILIETKAVRGRRRAGSGDSDANYVCERGVLKRSVLRDLPQSYYARHQLQLLWMNDAVQRTFGFAFDKALVMRIAPGSVSSYPLARTFAVRADDMRRAIALKTGKSKQKLVPRKRASRAPKAPARKRAKKK